MGRKPITVHVGHTRARFAEGEERLTRLAEAEKPNTLRDKKRPTGLWGGTPTRGTHDACFQMPNCHLHPTAGDDFDS